MAEISSAPQRHTGWLRNNSFDISFVWGVALIALLSGVTVITHPELFHWVLLADLWLLGYHHVIATFTRLAFDTESLREYRFYVFGLPLIVFGVTFALAWGIGLWVVATIYFYWQWFHYTRQSWGISQVYRAKSTGLVDEDPRFAQLCFYLLPIWGVLHRSWQAPEEFLFLETHFIPTPKILVDVVGILAVTSLVVWAGMRVRAWLQGQIPVAHTLYMISHFVIFGVGYLLIEDVTNGWLVINIWHNAQYILFVWLFNTNRFREGVDQKAVFLSTISQPQNFLRYIAWCLAISTTVYFSTSLLTLGNSLAGLPLIVLVYQAFNFHHYIVDSFIWKVRKKKMQKTLDL